MRTVLVDGNKLFEKNQAHTTIRSCLGLKGYYGDNLDALWDVLTTTNEEMRLYVYNMENPGSVDESYRKRIIGLLKEVSEQRDNFSFKILNLRKIC